jgi:hypothetical protein
MTDRRDRLEAELAGMKPRTVPVDLAERIGACLSHKSSWADRFLLSSIGAGAMAACVILTVLLMQSTGPAFPAPPQSATATPRLGDYQMTLARADIPWTMP